MTPWNHAVSSAKNHGGRAEDYIELHNWFDCTKQYTGDWGHRMLRHHSAGVEWAIQHFGHVIINSDNKEIPTKIIAEQHVYEDCGFIPTVKDWSIAITQNPKEWMLHVKVKNTKNMELV